METSCHLIEKVSIVRQVRQFAKSTPLTSAHITRHKRQYGALIHVLNMLSWTGFDWAAAPFKWQVLDVVYLVLDLTVVIGLIIGARFGFLAFFAAALSQIALYTILRPWVLDVPEEFRISAEDMQYLDGLVLFHIVTCLLMAWCVRTRSRISK